MDGEKRKDEAITPVLIIVMGTSGSGKSTLGSKLAASLDIPFIDGDDLHPPSNVAKMAAGHPLDDMDRIPWLLSIRSKAAEVCLRGQRLSEEKANPEKIRQLAEVYETSTQPKKESVEDDREGKVLEAHKYVQARDHDVVTGKTSSSAQKRLACVIACSALKKSYRQLLRHGLPEQSQAATAPLPIAVPPNALQVFHVYLQVSSQELLRRMHERKGHFMKEGMLRSQLDTLEEPIDEPDTIILKDAPVDKLAQEGTQYFASVL